jgi:hypothetical protein
MDWLRSAVIEGLQRLLVLRLPNSPASDTVVTVAEVWIAAFLNQRILWVENLDRPRINAAFLRATAEFEKWEAPVKVLQLLPARNQTEQLQISHSYQSQVDAQLEKLKPESNAFEFTGIPANSPKNAPMPPNIKKLWVAAYLEEENRQKAERQRIRDAEWQKKQALEELVIQEVDPHVVGQFFNILVRKYNGVIPALKIILTKTQLAELNIN